MSVKVRLASMATAQIITLSIILFVTARQGTQEITAKKVCPIYNTK